MILKIFLFKRNFIYKNKTKLIPVVSNWKTNYVDIFFSKFKEKSFVLR